jgi:hypothetical protein
MHFYNWIFIYFLPIKNVSGWSLTGQKTKPYVSSTNYLFEIEFITTNLEMQQKNKAWID